MVLGAGNEYKKGVSLGFTDTACFGSTIACPWWSQIWIFAASNYPRLGA